MIKNIIFFIKKSVDIFKSIWSWLSGKKTTIGAIVAFVAGGLFQLGLIDQGTLDTIIKYDLLILGIGIGHKAIKTIK